MQIDLSSYWWHEQQDGAVIESLSLAQIEQMVMVLSVCRIK